MNRSVFLAATAVVALTAATAGADVNIKLEPFVTAVNAPMAMVQVEEDLFWVLEQDGRVRAVWDGELQGTPVLDLRSKIVTQWHDFDERGTLGLALHPDFANNGLFYVAYSAPIDFQGDLAKQFWWDHTNVIGEFRVTEDNPDVADPSYQRIISAIDWPQFNHNGHWLGFGPDGMLYFTTGDGGYANDWGIGHNVTEGNGQDLTSPLGKIHRINVDGETEGNPDLGAEALPSIYAYGLRNAWRCSFDMGGDNALICGDVQQNSFEEVDVIEAGGNYGWRLMEASRCFNYVEPDSHPAECDTSGLIDPVIEYKNCTAQPDGCMGISVTGGYVYRGEHADWDGKYIFGDWSKSFGEMDGQIFIADMEGDTWSFEKANVTNMEGNVPYILAFAQDNAGEVYALTSVTTGPNGKLDTIYKIVPAE